VPGEFLTIQTAADRIGNAPIPLNHGAPDLSLTFDLHSQALLTAFLANSNFENITFQIPDVVRMIFDSNLYKFDTDKVTNKENFIERLVRHEFGNAVGLVSGDAMLSRFTDDLSKLAQDGGLTLVDIIGTNNVSKALIAFAMQMYYEDTVNALDSGKELFSPVAGGIQFDMADVSASFNQAKGSLYFNAYLESQYTAEEQAIIKTMLASLRNWYVQAGMGGLNIVDQLNNGAFMLGGVRSDNLSGGDAADLLVGNFGDDTLNGGAGQDKLLGGYGNDTYIIDNIGDEVIESVDEGTDDMVQSSITYTLGENVEKLMLTGTDTLDGTGNTLRNAHKIT
jgi:Ca2+-binding RTX toxin-like protein